MDRVDTGIHTAVCGRAGLQIAGPHAEEQSTQKAMPIVILFTFFNRPKSM